jgi:hypothetical protein
VFQVSSQTELHPEDYIPPEMLPVFPNYIVSDPKRSGVHPEFFTGGSGRGGPEAIYV